jgi:WD40 repeat protein
MLKMASFFSEIDELQNHFKTHNKTREYQAHSSKVHSVGWSCDGRRLASGSFDKSVTIFTLERDRLVRATLTSFVLLTKMFVYLKTVSLGLRGPKRADNH